MAKSLAERFEDRRKKLGISTPSPSDTGNSDLAARFEARRVALEESKKQAKIEAKRPWNELPNGAKTGITTQMLDDFSSKVSANTKAVEDKKKLADEAEQQKKAAEKAAKDARPSFTERVNKDLEKFPPILRPLAAIPSAISEITKPAQPFLESAITPGGGPAAVMGLTKGAAFGVSKLLPRLNNSGAGRIASTALSEAAVGAPLGVSNMLARDPEASGKEIALNAGLGAASGAVLGGLARGGAEGLQSLRNTATDVVGNRLNAAGALSRADSAPQYTGNLRLENKGQNVSRIMEDIRPAVNEAMTPPLESEKALRAWIKPILGNPSNNELAKLTYDDLIEIADEARKGMNTYDTAVQVAKARGIDLEQAFNQAPSIRAQVPQDASRRAYGITPELPNVSRPLVNKPQLNTPPKLADLKRVEPTPGPQKLSDLKSTPKPADDIEEILQAVQQPRVRDKVVSYLDEAEKAALARIAKRKNNLSANPIDEWADHAIVLAAQLGKGTIKAADVTETLVRQFGESVRPHAQTIYAKSKEILRQNERRAAEEVKASGGRDLLTTEGQIVNKPVRNTLLGAVETTKAAGRTAYQHQVDMFEPLKTISKETYDTAMDANRANQIANTIIGDKFVNPQGEIIGEGMQGIIRKAGRGNYNAVTDYLVARHAITRMARGEKVYADKLQMTNENIIQRVAALEQQYPQFKEVGKEWDQYFKNVRTVYGVEEGLITKALADELEKKNPNYAPMYRQFTTAEKIKGINSGLKPMFSGQKAPIKEVSPTGSARKIVDPVRSTIEQTGAWVKAAMNNRTMQAIVSKITENPALMKDIAEVVQPLKGQKNLRDVLIDDGETAFLEAIRSDFDQLFKRQKLDDDMILRAMVKGEPVHVKIKNPEAVKALMGMGSDQSNIVLNFLESMSKGIKFAATGPLAPMFATKSIGMDFGQAMVQADNPAKQLGYAIASTFSSIGKELKIPGLENMAKEFYQAGGGYSAVLRGERGLKKGIGKMKLEPLLSPKGIAKGVGNVLATPVKTLYTISDVSENLQRVAAFHAKLKQLGGERTPQNIREAMNASREITVNYSRKGLSSRAMESVIPYHNAAVQGMYRFLKAWKKNTIKTAAMVTLTVIVPKMIEYSKFNDDKDYQALTARERYRNIIISKNEDGTFNKAPMSPEYNAIGALVADYLEFKKHDDPGTFKGVADALVNSYTPPAVSGLAQGATQGGGIDQSIGGLANATSLSPIAAVFGNKSFTGAPIESLKVTDRSPKNRYDERTSSVSKWIGKNLKYSPMKTDYLLRAYGGDAARLLLPLTSDVGAGTPRNTLLKNFIVDPVFSNNLSNDYYFGKQRITQAYRDNEEVGDPLPEWLDDDLRKFVTSTAKGSITKQLSELTAKKKLIQANQLLNSFQKADKLRDIQQQMNEVYLEVNSRMEEAGVPLPRR